MTLWQIAIIAIIGSPFLWLFPRRGRVRAFLDRRAARRDPSWSARWTQMEDLMDAKARVR